jgi:hypothetical protein
MDEHARELGYLAMSWNRLHDNLSKIFDFIVKSPSPGLAASIWYALDSDFQQRKLLRAATERATHIDTVRRDSIVWVLDQIDLSLRHFRNDALHAPMVTMHSLGIETIGSIISADKTSDSPRAKSLNKKDIKEEIQLYRKLSTVLANYTFVMTISFRLPKHAWPDRPQLPHAHQTKSRKEGSRQSSDK